MKCVSTDTINDGPIRHGGIVHACAVSGANIVRDARESITNVVGGTMSRYETVLDATVERAIEALREKARANGYDGIVGLRISHPHIREGAIEIVAIGTGFWHDK